MWHHPCARHPLPFMLPRHRTLQNFPTHLSCQFCKEKGHSRTVIKEFLSLKRRTTSGSRKVIILTINWTMIIIPSCLILAMICVTWKSSLLYRWPSFLWSIYLFHSSCVFALGTWSTHWFNCFSLDWAQQISSLPAWISELRESVSRTMNIIIDHIVYAYM